MLSMLAGSVYTFSLGSEKIAELKSYLSDFFLVFKSNSVPFWELFKSDFYGNFKYVAVFFFCGFSIIGSALVAGMLFYKGFCIGMSAAVFLRIYGLQGLFGGVLAIIAQNAIFIPILILLAAESILLSFRIFDLRKNKSQFVPDTRGEMMNFTLKCVVYVFGLVLLSFLDTLILPIIMRLAIP